jgi:hypothetical protein
VTALFAALLGITLTALQPLTEAIAARHGASWTPWSIFCKAAAAYDTDGDNSGVPQAAAKHECCLGLAHAPAMVEPSAAFASVDFVTPSDTPLRRVEVATSVGIRDGPHQPRAPPLLR